MMNLEQRVELLEQELQVLKNQIQATLLDIQDKVLTNTYPSLRVGGNSGSGAVTDPVSDPANTIRSVRLSETHPDDHTDYSYEEPPQKVQRVSFNTQSERIDAPAPVVVRQLPSFESQREPEVPLPSSITEVNSSVEMTHATLTEAKAWAVDMVKQVGVARAQELIRQKARKGYFASDIERILLHFVSLYEDEYERHEEEEDVMGAYDDRHVDDSSPTEPTIIVQNQIKKKSLMVQPVESDASRKDKSKVDKITSSNLILRLIAGVQNAGVDMRWSKKRG